LLRDCDGVDSVSDDAGLIALEDGRLAGRLVDLRAAGRDFGAADRGRDVVDLGLPLVALGVAEFRAPAAVRAVDPALLPLVLAFGRAVLARVVRVVLAALVDEPRVDEPRADELRVEVLRVEVRPDDVRDDGRVADDVRDDGRVEVARLVVDVLRALVARPVVRLAGLAGAGLADDITLAAAVSAFAAVIMALVAVFIDFMADDIVCADAVALVAAAVILVAADVTLVAAEDTVLAAVAGVAAEVRLLRLAVGLLRAALAREPVEREAVDRDVVPRVDRDAALRVVARAAVLLAGFAAALRAVVDLALDVLELELELGRLAVPLDALRLTDLLRAVLAELRRVAARVVD
jgi:hypothetical protein